MEEKAIIKGKRNRREIDRDAANNVWDEPGQAGRKGLEGRNPPFEALENGLSELTSERPGRLISRGLLRMHSRSRS
jgi:hypothetical protein